MKIRQFPSVLLICMAALILFTACEKPPGAETLEEFRRKAMVDFLPRLNAVKQKELDRFHPLGTARRVQVNDVDFRWKGGKPTLRPEDIEQVATTFTLYWTSALRKNGWSRIREVFDMRSKKLIVVTLLETNGITNNQVLLCSLEER